MVRTTLLIWAALTVCGVAQGQSQSPYRLSGGDVVSILIDGIVGEFRSAHVHMPTGDDGTLPTIGTPFLIQADGTLTLPYVDPISVSGLTISEARKKIEQAYASAKVLTQPNRVYLSLMRKRTVSAIVIRSGSDPLAQHVQMPADRASVLAISAQAGLYDPHAAVRVYQPRSVGTQGKTAVIHFRSR
jgi:protein involved in polysaccharide export with SLBB domain